MTTWILNRPTDLSTLDFFSLHGPAVADIRTGTHYRQSAGALALDFLGDGFLYDGDRLLPFGSVEFVRLSDALDTLIQIGDMVWHLLKVLSYYNPLTDHWDEDGLLDYLFDWVDDITGSSGNDTFSGHGGDDILRGEGGIDTALYEGGRQRWSIERTGDGWRATDTQGSDGVDTLHGVERLRFGDGALALDLDGHAGTVARLIGALFGADALRQPDLVGTGLALLDQGMSEIDLAALAATSPLFEAHAGGASNAAFVEAVYRHVTGAQPTAEERDHYVGLLESGAHTRGSLALFAAETDALAQVVGLAAWANEGLPYAPMG